MTYDEWAPRYRRLTKTYGKPESGEQCAAYFEVLEHFTEGVIEQAIARVIAESKYWPAVADIRSAAQGIVAGAVYTPPECPLCHGNLWEDAQPFTVQNVRYTNVVRACPQCKPSTQAGVA